MNQKLTEILSHCCDPDIQRALKAIENELENPASYNHEERLQIAAGLSSLFFRDHNDNEALQRLIVRAERYLIGLGGDIVPWILEQIQDADAESAEHFARIVGEIGAPSVEPLLVRLNDSSSSSYATINFLLTVGYFLDSGVLKLLPRVFHYSKSADGMIKAQALYAIGRIANRISAGHLKPEERHDLYQVCFDSLSDTRALVRRQVVRALGKLHLNHYLSEAEVEHVYKAFRAILGLDDFEWDSAFIVRHEANLWLNYFRQDSRMHSSHKNGKESVTGRFYQDFAIAMKKELAPSTFYFRVHAPLIARKIEAGQFVIIRPNSTSERIPLSICGWNRDEGYIELIIMAVGRTSTEASLKNVGDRLHDVVGPLGQRSHVAKYDGTCVVLGGGFGTGAVIPTAADLKKLGNRVIGVVGARSKDLLLMVEELEAVCDEVIITTNDGSAGLQGFVTTALEQIMEKEKVAFTLAVGPVPMMKAVADATRDRGVECYVSLNAIMVDGTGMCGACRVTVDGKTRFACFHGPDFDGHKVNFEELVKRLGMFTVLEKEAADALSRGVVPLDH